MLWNAKNGQAPVGDARMPYARFGRGEKVFAVLPGLSDGLATVRGKALLLAKPYKGFFERYTVYMFSRKDPLPEGISIREMAADQAEALRALGVERASVMGVSQGGMIAQYLAVDCPGLVEKLVLAVTAPRVNEMIRTCVGRSIEYAERGEYRQLLIDTAERSYSPARLRRYRRLYPFLGAVAKQSDNSRFLRNARAILAFDALDELDGITCPTLIIGGEEDRVVGAGASRELHDRIPNSELFLYRGLGHGLFEEADDFYSRVYRFLEDGD